MPWQNNGDFYSFKQDSISQHAPTLSGVYGIFNFRHQIVIASAANIRNALLHHHRNTKFRFRRFEPTGFTFEIFSPEQREQRAQELIAEFAPIMPSQGAIGIATLMHSWRRPKARAFTAEPTQKKPLGETAATELPRRETESPSYLNPERFGLAGAICGIIFLAIGLVGLVPHLKNMFDSVVRNPTAIAESRQKIASGKLPSTAAEKLPATGNGPNTAITVAPNSVSPAYVPDSQAAANSATGWRAAAAQTARPAPTPPAQPQTVTGEQPVHRAAPVNSWSVQALATADQQLANDRLNKLKAKGYQAFVVIAEIKGQTWHRLRVGNFATRQEAEAVRAALQANEGFRDAYIAGGEQSGTTLAFNRR